MQTSERVRQLVDWVQQGKFMEAYAEFYHDDVIMQENSDPPRHGLKTTVELQQQIMNGATVHDVHAETVLAEGDQAAILWVLDATLGNGQHIHREEIALQTWKDGKISHERFFYEPPAGMKL